MKSNKFLTAIGAIAIFSSLSAFAETRLSAEFDTEFAVDSYSIYESAASEIDVLVDYEMVAVDCHGLRNNYSLLQASRKTMAFVDIRPNLHRALPCPSNHPPRQAQAGLKYRIRAGAGNLGLFAQVRVPKGAKVEYVIVR